MKSPTAEVSSVASPHPSSSLRKRTITSRRPASSLARARALTGLRPIDSDPPVARRVRDTADISAAIGGFTLRTRES